ncbi:DUF4345 domain-containing protein [Mycobacterium sp. DL]
MGVTLVAIGIYHLVGGMWSVPGAGAIEGEARATVDSRERFYAAIFIGYGLAYIWAARQPSIPLTAVNWLAAVFLLGGLGRVLSVGVYGWPHWFQIPLLTLELVIPLVFFALTAAERRSHTTAHGERKLGVGATGAKPSTT